jgi:signal transduction histidine kinase
MTATHSKQPLERQIAGAILIAALLAAVATVAVRARFAGHVHDPAADVNATVDALAAALSRGAAPQPVLDAFAAAGNIRAATVFAPRGERIASTGTPSPNAEQIFRTLSGGGSLAVEPRIAIDDGGRGDLPRDTGIAAACALVAALLIAAWMSAAMRRRLETIRAEVDEAARDQTYATRLRNEGGALRPLAASVNKLLDQIQQRDLAARRRTIELETANKDLESFAATVSHDLRAPVAGIAGFAQALDEDYAARLDDIGRECIHWIRQSAAQMSNIIEGMLKMARLSRVEVHRGDVDITRMARDITDALRRANPERDVEFIIHEGIIASGDERLLHAVLENLIGNAFKFTSKRPGARIEIGARDDDGTLAFYVRDNGAGFAPEHAAKMFRPFQRLHSEKEFSGTGIGLATVHRIVQRHGGRVWAEGEPEKGATIYFTTGSDQERAA